MASKSPPVFPFPQPQHFSDYGFDPQIDYFQVLEEARKHRRETSRSLDSIHFKLQKPISKDDSNKKRRWWKNALLHLLLFKSKWIHHHQNHDVHQSRSARAFRASLSGPVYITEPTTASTTRPSSGPLAGTLTPTTKHDLQIPYLSLRELNMEQQQYTNSTSPAMPIYLVT